MSAKQIYDLLEKEYVSIDTPYKLKKCHIDSDNENFTGSEQHKSHVSALLVKEGRSLRIEEYGNGPVDAFVKGMKKAGGIDFTLEEYAEHAVSHGEDSLAASYIMIRDKNGKNSFGAGIDSNIAIASIKAVMSALNRL